LETLLSVGRVLVHQVASELPRQEAAMVRAQFLG